tara:strand:- start:692 stop:874 length:183 start_codon:yes stop_codon:yes gene_type:complete
VLKIRNENKLANAGVPPYPLLILSTFIWFLYLSLSGYYIKLQVNCNQGAIKKNPQKGHNP